MDESNYDGQVANLRQWVRYAETSMLPSMRNDIVSSTRIFAFLLVWVIGLAYLTSASGTALIAPIGLVSLFSLPYLLITPRTTRLYIRQKRYVSRLSELLDTNASLEEIYALLNEMEGRG